MHIDIRAKREKKRISSWKKEEEKYRKFDSKPMPNQLPMHDNISMLIAKRKQKENHQKI